MMHFPGNVVKKMFPRLVSLGIIVILNSTDIGISVRTSLIYIISFCSLYFFFDQFPQNTNLENILRVLFIIATSIAVIATLQYVIIHFKIPVDFVDI